MKRWLTIWSAACLGMPAALHAQEKAEPVAAPAVEELVRGLGDDSFRVREEASKELWELGEAALPALEEAAESADPEQAIRARDLIRKIQLHITPDTDPTVVDLVQRYAEASAAEKAALLGKMRGKRAWRQMLKLYAAEKDPAVREKLQPMMAAVALKGARERLMKGDSAAAKEFLELAPADVAGLLALAEFHRSHGTLQTELERAKSLPGRKGAAWQLALLRAAGDPAAAREAAVKAGEERLAASLAVLAGDPRPWLAAMQADAELPAPAKIYAEIAGKRWQGAKFRNELERLTRLLKSRDPTESGAALNALFLLGEVEIAEPAFTAAQPLAAFRHFEVLERLPEAMQALGLDAEKPDYRAWVEQRLAKLQEEDIGDQHEVSDGASELMALANFLERRGMHDEARAAYQEPLLKLAEDDFNAFADHLSKLFGSRASLSGAPLLARSIAMAWAGEDDQRWEEVIAAAFGDEERIRAWWDWLAEVKPKADRTARLDAMLAVFGLTPDPARLRDEWLGLLWKSAEAAPGNERIARIERLAELSSEIGDVENSLRAWQLLPAENQQKIFWGQTLIHFSAMDRWQEAADLILKQIETITAAGQEPGADLHAYAAAALRMAGRNDEAATHDGWVDRLALGNAAVALRVGNGYAYGRDYRRAAEWWTRAAIQADPDGEEYALALKFHSDSLLENEQWPLAAATSEVLGALYVGSDYLMSSQLPMMRLRLQSDTARALARLPKDRPAALAMLADCHRLFASDGSLADFFFPALRKVGLLSEHDAWFRESWRHFENVIRRYPDSDNTLNTAAWFASRAMRELDQAEKLLSRALAMNPRQAAYLDTMAEIQFARGRRAKALEWSQLAINISPEDTMIRRQHERFRSEPFPK
jgi:hypothetical protein